MLASQFSAWELSPKQAPPAAVLEFRQWLRSLRHLLHSKLTLINNTDILVDILSSGQFFFYLLEFCFSNFNERNAVCFKCVSTPKAFSCGLLIMDVTQMLDVTLHIMGEMKSSFKGKNTLITNHND